MTGGFYDKRRSKLKFMNLIRQNALSITEKENELQNVRSELQDILFLFHFYIYSQARCLEWGPLSPRAVFDDEYEGIYVFCTVL